jgi:DNA polymerase-4
MNRYREESRCIMQVLASTGALIDQASVDEAYLDLSSIYSGEEPDDCLRQSWTAARDLKAAILKERDLTASIGIAANKLLAKLASDFQKPDGLTLIAESEKIRFLRPLPVRSLHGVGKVTGGTGMIVGPDPKVMSRICIDVPLRRDSSSL